MPIVFYLLEQYGHKKTILLHFILGSAEGLWFSWMWFQKHLKSVS